MGLEAAALVDRAIKASHGIVRLSAQDPGSRSGKRLRRSVEVRVGGRWQDLSRMELEQGLALWLPNGVEWAHNRDYDALAEEAAAAHRDLYDPGACAGAPSPDAQLAVDVNWDADGDDEHDLNGEWVDIRNLGPADVSLAGWWLRDSWLRFSSPHVPGFLFPSYAVVPPAAPCACMPAAARTAPLPRSGSSGARRTPCSRTPTGRATWATAHTCSTRAATCAPR